MGYTVLFRIALAYALQRIINAALSGEVALVGNQVMITLVSFGIGVIVQMITGYGVDKCVRETIADVKQTAMGHLLRLTMSRFSQTNWKSNWGTFHRLLPTDYPHARKIRLVMDQLNTHAISSLCMPFPPDQARAVFVA